MKLPPLNTRTKKRYFLSFGLGIMFLAVTAGWLWRFKYFSLEPPPSLTVITPRPAPSAKQLVLSPTQLKPVLLADNNSLKTFLTTLTPRTASLSATLRELNQSLAYSDPDTVGTSRPQLNEALEARLDALAKLSAQINLEAGEMPEAKEPLLGVDKELKNLVGELLNLRQATNEATAAAQLDGYAKELIETWRVYRFRIPKYHGYRLLYGLRYLTGRLQALWPNLAARADGFSENPASEQTLKPLLADYQSELFRVQDSMATASALLNLLDTGDAETNNRSFLTLTKTYDEVLAALGKITIDLQGLADFWLKAAPR